MSEPRGPRIGPYIRTSKPAEEDRQTQAADAWCSRHGLAISRTYSDIGGGRHESTNIKRRPGLAAMLADCAAGLWDVVLVEEQSRFGALGREFDHYMWLFETYECEL